MRKTPIFFVMAFLFACLSCGVPEDDKPGTVTSPLIDRTEIPEGDSGDGETRNEYIYLFKQRKLELWVKTGSYIRT